MKHFFKTFLTVILFSFLGCKTFMHSFTNDKAQDTYIMVTGKKDNFGDKRLKYIKAFRKHSDLANFLEIKNRKLPDFIFEYKSESERRGIKLFYAKADSVYVFEEVGKNCSNSILKEERKMDETEKQIYQELKKLANR